MKLLLRWAAAAAAVAAAVHFVPGIHLTGGVGSYFGVALILGLVNAIVRPVIQFLGCGLVVLTLGLFLLVINAGMLLLTSAISQGLGLHFSVDGFVPALLGSILISLVTYLAGRILGDGDSEG